MAQKIKTDQRLVSYLRCGDYQQLEAALDGELQTLLNTFMDRFGGRCYYDCMLLSPTFLEQHDLFWDLVKGCLDASEKDPLLKHNSNATDRERFTRSLMAQLPLLKRRVYRCVLKLAQKAIALRERGRFFQSLLFGEIRLVVQELGKKLTHKGCIKNTQDIFYLHLNEIESLLDGKYQFPETIIKSIEIRKEAFAENAEKELPEFFYLDRGEHFNPDAPIVTVADDPWVLKGRGVSKGQVNGTARIILDPTNGENLNPGDILVTKTMDPGWTPLFLIAGGLVLEKGGFLSHAAIVAREFGIPAVAGISNATTKIQEGQRIMLDGNAGWVNILSD